MKKNTKKYKFKKSNYPNKKNKNQIPKPKYQKKLIISHK
jgi:hypothetical protein